MYILPWTCYAKISQSLGGLFLIYSNCVHGYAIIKADTAITHHVHTLKSRGTEPRAACVSIEMSIYKRARQKLLHTDTHSIQPADQSKKAGKQL